MNAEPTRELLQAVKAKDPVAFERFVSAYAGRVARLADRVLGWPGEVEDVVQDVFLAVWRGIGSYRGGDDPWAWLATITVNRCRNVRRSWGARRTLLNKLQALAGRGGQGDSPAEADAAAKVRQAVRALPAKLREVAVLRYLDGMAIEQISQVVGTTRNAVDVRLHRARVALKPILEEITEPATTGVMLSRTTRQTQ